ncbi:hypothetical protein Tco_1169040, partial [Tanacetum coccineum]
SLTLPPEETCCSLPLEETGCSVPPEETDCSLPPEKTCYSLPPEKTPLLIEARAESPSYSNVPRVIGCLNHADIMPLIRGTTCLLNCFARWTLGVSSGNAKCRLNFRSDQVFGVAPIRGSLDRRVPPEGFHCFDRRLPNQRGSIIFIRDSSNEGVLHFEIEGSKGVSEGKDATTNKLNEDADPNRRFLDDGFDDDDSPN